MTATTELQNKKGHAITTCELGAYVHSQMEAVSALQIAQALDMETMSENLIDIEERLINAFDALPGSKFVWCVVEGATMFYHQKAF